ncbi:hypothetical protein [Arenibaculum sp.]|uniref:hypothetical protein n=1 Tax=Arenibaculum sp. TaxID=2865862 RepID=UPI002E0F8204|nr:hypothetical protein [Arenibaculum sp.]
MPRIPFDPAKAVPSLARIAGIAALVALGACAGSGPPGAGLDAAQAGVDGAPGPEPTLRDPLGYSSRPIDSSPTTSELEGGLGLPRTGEVIAPGEEFEQEASPPPTPLLPEDAEGTAVE